jgi:hypothetical protein
MITRVNSNWTSSVNPHKQKKQISPNHRCDCDRVDIMGCINGFTTRSLFNLERTKIRGSRRAEKLSYCNEGLQFKVPGFNTRSKTFFSAPRRPDRLWDPPSLLSNGYQGLFTRSVRLATDHLVPRSRMVKPYLHSPTGLYGVVLN